MTNTALNIVLGAAGAIVALLSFSEEMSKTKRLAFIHKLSFKIPVVVIMAVIGIWATIEKDNQVDQEKKYEKQTAMGEQKKHDSVNDVKQALRDTFYKKREDSLALDYKIHIDSSYSKSLKASNEALAKYNLKIIDSLNTVVNTINISSLDPQLSVAPANVHSPIFISENNNSDLLKIQLVSANATAHNIFLQCYFIRDINDTIRLLPYHNALSFGEKNINKDVVTTTGIEFPPVYKSIDDTIYLCIIGKYYRQSEYKDEVKYYQCFGFNFKQNKFLGERSYIEFKDFLQYLKEKNLPTF
jgi:hypothetical protein